MRKKRQPFPNAVLSKKHFQQIPVWRVGYVFVNLVKHVLDVTANSHWYNFGYQAWKFTKTVFERYCEKHHSVWTHCKLYQELSEDCASMISKTSTPVKKRSRSNFELDTPEAPRLVKTVCLITDSSEEESSADSD